LNRTEEIGELIKALCLAKKGFKPISKDGKNPFLNSKYVTLDGIVNATEDALNANGLVIIHHQEITTEDTFLVTELIHESGQIIGTETSMNQYIGPVTVNEKGNVKVNPLQVFGSVITYLKRYHISELLNVAVDEDADGNSTEGKKQEKPSTNEDRKSGSNVNPLDALNKKYFAMLAPKKLDEQARHDWQVANIGKASTNDWDVADYQKAIGVLEAKPKTEQQKTFDNDKEARFQKVKAEIDAITDIANLDAWVAKNVQKIGKSDLKDAINEYILARTSEIERKQEAEPVETELDALGDGEQELNENNQQ
jgi:hypothetical protein